MSRKRITDPELARAEVMKYLDEMQVELADEPYMDVDIGPNLYRAMLDASRIEFGRANVKKYVQALIVEAITTTVQKMDSDQDMDV